MPIWKQALLRRYHKPADDGTGGGGGGSDDAAAAQAAADKAAAEKAAAEKAAADKAAGKPSDEEAKLLKENMQRKQKIDELNKELEPLKALKATLEELGGVEALKGLVDEKKTAETKALEAKGEWDRLKVRMAEEHAKELKTAKDASAAIAEQLAKATSQINELTIGSAFSGSKFITEETTMTPSKARVIYGDHFELVDGKVVAFDKPRSAKDRTPLVDGSGNSVAFEEAMRKIVEADPEKDHVLRNKAKPGAASDTRKADPAGRKSEPASGLDKIGAGLKGLGVLLT